MESIVNTCNLYSKYMGI